MCVYKWHSLSLSLCVYLCLSLSLSLFLCISFFQTGAVQDEFYKDSDLTLGGVVNVWGRRVVICDCDNFTKEHYRTKYGIGKSQTLQNVVSKKTKTIINALRLALLKFDH